MDADSLLKERFEEALAQGKRKTLAPEREAELWALIASIEREEPDTQTRREAVAEAAIDAMARGLHLPRAIHKLIASRAFEDGASAVARLDTLDLLVFLGGVPRGALARAIPSERFDRDVVDNCHRLMAMLIARGADPCEVDLDGRGLLHLAALGKSTPETFLMLMEAGADPEAKTPRGESASDYIRSLMLDAATPALEARELREVAGLPSRREARLAVEAEGGLDRPAARPARARL